MSKALTAWIEGIGFLAPGLPDWPTARAVLRGEQAAVGVADGKLVEDVVGVAGQALGTDDQFARQVVEAGGMQRHAAHAGQVALARLAAFVIVAGEQGAVDGHGLGGVFDAVGGTEAAIGAQRVGRVGVAASRAGDRLA